MRPHARRFRTLLWEGIKENWWRGGQVEFDPVVELDRMNADLEKISGVSEYSRGMSPAAEALSHREPYYSWRQHSVTLPVVEATLKESWMDDTDEIRNHAAQLIAEGYAEWSDEHHRLSSEVNNGGFFTVDEDDLNHLEHYEDQPELESDHRRSSSSGDIDTVAHPDEV
jgi:hypothetical protein